MLYVDERGWLAVAVDRYQAWWLAVVKQDVVHTGRFRVYS